MTDRSEETNNIEALAEQAIRLLDAVEPDLLLIEMGEGTPDQETRERIYHAFHAVRLLLSPQGFVNISCLSLAVALSLKKRLDDGRALDDDYVEALLHSTEKLRFLLERVTHSDRLSIRDDIEVLDPYLRGGSDAGERGDVSRWFGARAEGLEKIYLSAGESRVAAGQLTRLFESNLRELLGGAYDPGGGAEKILAESEARMVERLSQTAATESCEGVAHEELRRLFDGLMEPLMSTLGENRLLRNVARRMERSTTVLQENLNAVRLEKVTILFDELQRGVAEIEGDLVKPIKLETVGGAVAIPLAILDVLRKPFAELLALLATRSLERGEKREEGGKGRTGLLRLTALQEGERIRFDFSDDGCGVEPEEVRTKEAVAEMVAKLKGSLSFIPSVTGQNILVTFPLPRNSRRALVVSDGVRSFLLPAENLVDFGGDAMGEGEMITVRLADITGASAGPAGGDVNPVMVAHGGKNYALYVAEQTPHPQELLVKRLPACLGSVSLYDGAAILATGEVALSLNLDELVKGGGDA